MRDRFDLGFIRRNSRGARDSFVNVDNMDIHGDLGAHLRWTAAVQRKSWACILSFRRSPAFLRRPIRRRALLQIGGKETEINLSPRTLRSDTKDRVNELALTDR